MVKASGLGTLLWQLEGLESWGRAVKFSSDLARVAKRLLGMVLEVGLCDDTPSYINIVRSTKRIKDSK